ncbi:hypothetical protein [Devosia sp.]|uniref:hypothetical protein n=1 Tax=Devosia sp. TaxID=1871048 RepID=UPI001ACC9C13|nr:hypothetical protein [Devosia sp.]MBN9308199.1 hypothetical protein [Devosia sp.]
MEVPELQAKHIDRHGSVIADQPEVREKLDLALTRALMQGLSRAFADHTVSEIRMEAPHPYYQRDWAAPAPPDVTGERLGPAVR